MARWLCVILLAAAGGTVFAADGRPDFADVRPRPQQSFGQTVDRALKYVLEGLDRNEHWKKTNAVKDKDGRLRPPYFFYATETMPVSFPAFHHSIAINSLLQYRVYSGDERALKRAEDLADWNIANSTPREAKYPGLPYSTCTKGKVGGSWDGETVMSDKPGYMGMAYLRLFRTTGKTAYLEAAERIADTLVKLQTPEGSWPFRFNPNTGKIQEPYTSNVVPGLMLLDELDARSDKPRYAEQRKKALAWIMDNPVKTMNWSGFYEDVATGRKSIGNWSTIDTARYLVAHRADDPAYLPAALALKDWVDKTFVKKIRVGNETVEGVAEQTCYMHVMAGHSGHFAELLSDLYAATGEEAYRTRALQLANGMTYELDKSGRILMNLGGKSFWFSAQFGVPAQLLDLMGEFPESAPADETHLLKTTAAVTAIQYEPQSIGYSTDGASTDVLKLATRSVRVTVNGKDLPAGDGVTAGWRFDTASGVLRLTHDAGRVTVRLVSGHGG